MATSAKVKHLKLEGASECIANFEVTNLLASGDEEGCRFVPGKKAWIELKFASPIRLYSICLEPWMAGMVTIKVSGESEGRSSWLAQGVVPANWNTQGRAVKALDSYPLAPTLASEVEFKVGRGDHQLSPQVASEEWSGVRIELYPHAEHMAEPFGLVSLTIRRALSDDERAQQQAAVSQRLAPTAPPPSHPAPPAPRIVPAAPPPPVRRIVPANPAPVKPLARARVCACERAHCHGCGPPCKLHAAPSALFFAKTARNKDRPMWVCALVAPAAKPGDRSKCGFVRFADEVIGCLKDEGGSPTGEQRSADAGSEEEEGSLQLVDEGEEEADGTHASERAPTASGTTSAVSELIAKANARREESAAAFAKARREAESRQAEARAAEAEEHKKNHARTFAFREADGDSSTASPLLAGEAQPKRASGASSIGTEGYRKRSRIAPLGSESDSPHTALEIDGEKTSSEPEEEEEADDAEPTHLPLLDKRGAPAPRCQYGDSCYRLNVNHLLSVAHSRAALRKKLIQLEPKHTRGPLYRVLSAFGIACDECATYDELLSLMFMHLTDSTTAEPCATRAALEPIFIDE